MNKPEFLPDNPYTRDKSKRLEVNYEPQLYDAWESGSESTFKSLVKWLFEPCTSHTCWDTEFNSEIHYEDKNDRLPMPLHRYLCPKCMYQLKEWSEK